MYGIRFNFQSKFALVAVLIGLRPSVRSVVGLHFVFPAFFQNFYAPLKLPFSPSLEVFSWRAVLARKACTGPRFSTPGETEPRQPFFP